jgi:hypothetical protein
MERKFKEGNKVILTEQTISITYTVCGHIPNGRVILYGPTAWNKEPNVFHVNEDDCGLVFPVNEQPKLQIIYPHVNDIVRQNGVGQVYVHGQCRLFAADNDDTVHACYNKAATDYQWPKAQWPPHIGEIIYDMDENAFVCICKLHLDSDGTVEYVTGCGEEEYFKDTCGTEWQWVYRRSE